jgi:hypothetical protein
MRLLLDKAYIYMFTMVVLCCRSYPKNQERAENKQRNVRVHFSYKVTNFGVSEILKERRW